MASWKKAFPGKFLKKEDLTGDFTATIESWSIEEVGSEDGKKEEKLTLHFKQSPPGTDVRSMVCNKTNCGIIEEVMRTEDIELWIGKQITLYSNPSITFGGKRVGGISVRDKSPQDDPFATVAPIAHAPFADDVQLLTKSHYRLAVLYNGVLKINPSAAALFPAKFFVVGDKKLNWETVLKLQRPEAIKWMDETLIPAIETYLESISGAPAMDITEDDIPF